MDLKKMFKSFSFAFNGLLLLVKSENNFKFHFFSAILILGISAYLKLSSIDWLFVILAICLVFLTEAFNTSIEKICDEITQERRKTIGAIKDISAAAVLIASFFALCVFCLIILPKLYDLVLTPN